MGRPTVGEQERRPPPTFACSERAAVTRTRRVLPSQWSLRHPDLSVDKQREITREVRLPTVAEGPHPVDRRHPTAPTATSTADLKSVPGSGVSVSVQGKTSTTAETLSTRFARIGVRSQRLPRPAKSRHHRWTVSRRRRKCLTGSSVGPDSTITVEP